MMIPLYNGKYKLEFNEGSHRYKINGEYKTGVTTLLSLLDKGESLLQWSVNCAVDAMVAGATPEEAKSAWRTKRDSAADIGKRVHAWIEAHNKGETLAIEPDMQQCINAYLQWESENDIKHLFSERVVYSELYDYPGTCDDVHEARARDKARRLVNDYKTGSPEFEWDPKLKRYTGRARPRLTHLLQNALYDQAIYEEDGVYADALAVTYITKDGKLYFFEAENTEELRELALSVVQTHKQLKAITNAFKEVGKS